MVRQQCAPCEPGSPTDVKIRNGAGDGEAQAAASSSPGNLYTLHMVMEDKHPTCLPHPAASIRKDQKRLLAVVDIDMFAMDNTVSGLKVDFSEIKSLTCHT